MLKTGLTFSSALALAFFINLLLFLAMQAMVNNSHDINTDDNISLALELINIRDLPPPEKQLKKKELEKPEAEKKLTKPEINVKVSPPAMPKLALSPIEMESFKIKIQGQPSLGTPDFANASLAGFGHGELAPTVHIPPQYPPKAMMKGIEGTVIVEFTIAKDGSVFDLEIASASPPRIFNRAALKAVKRWRYSPQHQDGVVVEQRANATLVFELENNK